MTLGEIYQRARARLADLASPGLDARLLICHALGLSHEQFILRSHDEVTEQQRTDIDTAITERLTGRPVAKIIGRKEFYGRDFITTDDTLDPRPDSETLIEAVLRHLPRGKALNILDLGTGTGCLLLTLLAEIPDASGVAVDQSQAALAVAQRNARTHQMTDRATFLHSDWFDAVTGRFDIIISNPPYIPQDHVGDLAPDVRLFDPLSALAGGADGLDPYRIIIPRLGGFLNPGGIVAFELGLGQDEAVAAMMRHNGFTRTLIFDDLAGIARVVMGIDLQTVPQGV